jgi:2-methylisocitrate lyase-like PEP mutase family enzyme
MSYAADRGNAAALRARMEREVVACPGAANALAARLVEQAGFPACYVTGAGIPNTFLGAPDIGLVTLSELADHVSAMRDAVGIPLLVDADTGFGNALGVQRTVRVLERAGADALQLEDQVSPKRCGHFSGKQLVPVEEMVGKIRAAVDARDSALVIARTDARAVEGWQAALDRAGRYAEAGADLLFVEAPETAEELLSLPEILPQVPHVANLVEGGRTPLLPLERLGGFGVVLYANVTMQAAMRGMREALETLARTGSLAEVRPLLTGWAERQTIVGKEHFDRLAERYGAPMDAADPADPAEPAHTADALGP